MFGVSQELEEAYPEFADRLPHGSGIDDNWGYEEPPTGKYIYFTNSYHLMNGWGIYVGWQDFRVRFLKNDFEEGNWRKFDIQFSYPLIIKQDTLFFREYLWETVFHSIVNKEGV